MAGPAPTHLLQPPCPAPAASHADADEGAVAQEQLGLARHVGLEQRPGALAISAEEAGEGQRARGAGTALGCTRTAVHPHLTLPPQPAACQPAASLVHRQLAVPLLLLCSCQLQLCEEVCAVPAGSKGQVPVLSSASECRRVAGRARRSVQAQAAQWSRRRSSLCGAVRLLHRTVADVGVLAILAAPVQLRGRAEAACCEAQWVARLGTGCVQSRHSSRPHPLVAKRGDLLQEVGRPLLHRALKSQRLEEGQDGLARPVEHQPPARQQLRAAGWREQKRCGGGREAGGWLAAACYERPQASVVTDKQPTGPHYGSP